VHEKPIFTPRLELHHISPPGNIDLLESKDQVAAIAGRSFTNPHQVLVSNSGPLSWRVPQVKTDPTCNKWFVRFIVLKETKEVIGSTSFHGAPDENGMIEIGLGIEEAFHNQGYAREALVALWQWACGFSEVKRLRYTVSPDNLPSIAVINYFGFDYIGEQMDEIDGPENIYEMGVAEFKQKWGSEDER
jgi:RimJ/RimL family protein N-acetyltransferase